MKSTAYFLLIVLVWGWTGSDGHCQKIKIKKSAVKDAVKEGEKETAQAAGGFKVGDVAEGLETDGKWYKVDILRVEGAKYFIHWQGFAPKYDRLIEADKLRAIAGGSSSAAATASAVSSGGGFKAGEKVEVMYSGSWRLGSITKVKNGKYSVNIGIDAASYLEFTEDKIRTPVAAAVVEKKEDKSGFKVGDKVDVLGRSMWLEATVLEPVKNSRGEITMYKVKETVSGEEWNASVNPIRIRKYTGPVVWNFTGKDFQVGQYVKVWYSGNDSIICQILDVKDNQFLIEYGGYRDTWFAFDDKKVRNDVRSAAVAASKLMQSAFFDECSNYAQSVFAFARMINPNLVLYNQNRADPVSTEFPGIMKDLDELDAIIKSKYANIQNTEELFPNELSKIPGTWRETCERRKELALKFVEKDVKDHIGYMTDDLNKEIENIHVYTGVEGVTSLTTGLVMLWDIVERDGKFTRPKLQAEVKILADNAKIAGYNADADIKKFWELYDGMKTRGLARINELAPAANSGGKFKDATAEEFLKRRAMDVYPGCVILRTAAMSADYRIEVNAFGTPRYRTKYVEILLRLPSGRCLYTCSLYAQDYNGGSYGPGYIWGGDIGGGYQKCQ